MATDSEIFDNLYGSRYLSAADLHGETLRHKIGKIDVAELKDKDGTTKRKFVVYFSGVEKSLVLNRTNALRLAAALGTKDHTKWIGVVCELYAEMTSLGKEGVRLRVLRPAATAANPDPDLNDHIPF